MIDHFTDRVRRVSPSATLAISNQASELEAEGVDVVDVSVGEPDFDTPQNIKDAAQRAMADGETGYTPSSGIPELREAIAEKLAADGLDHSPGEVMVTPGANRHCTRCSRRSSRTATRSSCWTRRGSLTRR